MKQKASERQKTAFDKEAAYASRCGARRTLFQCFKDWTFEQPL